MKKIITSLTLSLTILLSLQGLAQNDSLRTSPSIKIVADSSFNANDTIKIGNMLIIKKQGDQNNNNDNKIYYNRKRNRLYGTSLNITNGRIKKDTFLSVNDDTVRLGRLNIIKSQDSNNKKDWESMIEDGDFDNTRISIERAPKKLKNVTSKPLTLMQISYMTAAAIKRDGLRTTSYFDNAVKAVFNKDFFAAMATALGGDVQIQIRQIGNKIEHNGYNNK